MNNELYEITSYDQIKALSHPLRREIFNLLGDGVARTSQHISIELEEPRNKVHYHIKELVRVGLLILSETKMKGNFKEKYYLPISNKVIIRMDPDVMNQTSSRFDMDQSILANHQVQYLKALQEYLDSKNPNQNPFLMGLKKELTIEQLQEFKNDLHQLFDKWFEVEGNDTVSDMWELSISMYPVKKPN